MDKRGNGILLAVTSLPSNYGIGDLGPAAYEFSDFLCRAKQRYWQILPLNPTDLQHGNSPYHSNSAFAFNPLLISPDFLARDGWIGREDLDHPTLFPVDRVNYHEVTDFKNRIFDRAYSKFKHMERAGGFDLFCRENAVWLDNFSLFVVLKAHFKGQAWFHWPSEFCNRDQTALAWVANEFNDEIQKVCFTQYLLFQQWWSLKEYCNNKGIQVFGDIPIYVVHDSADVWSHPELFNLDHAKMPLTVAGVPPDYFSDTGQLWGNPVYRWDLLKERDFDWWIERIRHNLKLYDLIRIDHFRGFVAYWEVPAGEKNAINGRWVNAPVYDFFHRIAAEFPDLPIIAEDLGVITPDVVEVMRRFKFPGMKILVFAFGDDLPSNPYAPHNLEKNCLIYTGTHDNNTARGWFEKETTPEMRNRLSCYIGREVTAERIGRDLVRLAMMSVADVSIFPLQDFLGLGEEARMNRPATQSGNWKWRLDKELLSPSITEDLRKMTEIFGRA